MPNIASCQDEVVVGGKAVHGQDVAGAEVVPKLGRHQHLGVGGSSETVGNDAFISDGLELCLIHSARLAYYLYGDGFLPVLDSSSDNIAIHSLA
jgi:hypothetical protein